MKDILEIQFMKEAKERIMKHLKKGNLAEVIKEVDSTLHQLDAIPLNIAITGASGSGKSTFINAMRDMGDKEAGSAPTGVVETTMEPTPYTHPHHETVTYWDLPGIGTPNFKASEYLERVKFSRYDFFIIIASERFTEHHIMLAQQIRTMKKNFFFVRSKIDNDSRASKRDGKNFNEKKMLDSIRENCVKSLLETGQPQVFLISSHERDKYDFTHLLKALKKALPNEKQYKYLQSLPNISSQELQTKKDALRSTVPLVAIAAFGKSLVPGLAEVTEASTIAEHIKSYIQSFGLDEKSLKNLAEVTGKSVSELKNEMKSPFVKNVISEDLINRELEKRKGAGYIIAKAIFSWIPVLSAVVAGPMSASAVTELLSSALDEIAADAKTALQLSLQCTKEKQNISC